MAVLLAGLAAGVAVSLGLGQRAVACYLAVALMAVLVLRVPERWDPPDEPEE